MGLGILDPGQDKDVGPRSGGKQVRQKIEAVILPEIEVEQEDIRTQLCRDGERLTAVGGFPNHAEPWLALEQHAQPRPHDRMIIDE
jgi:hypothetical protein